jgi:LAO/AO transport system kinase
VAAIGEGASPRLQRMLPRRQNATARRRDIAARANVSSVNDSLATSVIADDRKALAQAITLVESRREQDQEAASALLQRLLPHAGKAIRVGVTGAPGVGKSTLIDALGCLLCDRGMKVAVLAVDPSSSVSGGSILGDKTRMSELARRERAFVRPSPGGDTLGGVAARTREAMVCCEAAGFDVVLVETIGTGQSETAVATMVDLFLLLLSPAAGDELQGIKRGVMELADLVLVHKADGDLAPAANRAAQQCLAALRVLHSGDAEIPAVLVGSSTTGLGIGELWAAIESRAKTMQQDGSLQRKRAAQARAWLDAAVHEALVHYFERHPAVQAELARLRDEVGNGRALPHAAARRLLALWRGA